MSDDLRARLQRLGDRARVGPGAFERLDRARRRRDRNRRITAGTVALLLTIGGSVAIFGALRGGERTVGDGGVEGGFFALWPEQTAEGLADAQERLESGDPGLAWRTDPLEVARRFATDVLLWPAVDVRAEDPSEANWAFASLHVPAGSACDAIVGDAECPSTPTTVAMRRSGDLWNVVDVHGEDLVLPLSVGEVVASGTTISVPTSLPDGEEVSMGVAFLSACDTSGIDRTVEAAGGELTFLVPKVPVGCTGYVYAMRPATGAGAVAIGSFVFTDAEAVPAIGYLIEEVSAVPVRFSNDAPDEVAELTCDSTGTISPERTAVVAQADGVHIAVTNVADVPISFSGESWGDGAAPGERVEVVWPVPPGAATVSCSVEDPSFGGVASSATVTVVDPEGLYVPADLECATGEAYGQAPSYVEGAKGFAGEPAQVVRDHVTGLEFDDVVDPGGYPESAEPVVRIVRDGAVVGKVTLFDDGRGGWLLSSLEGCSGTSFGWSDEPSGVTGATGPAESPFLSMCAPEGAARADLRVDGRELGFDPRCLWAPAGEELTIVFRNLDEGVRRNISIYAMAPCLEEAILAGAPPSCPPETLELPFFVGEIVTGVTEISYQVGDFEPGVYYFQDDVHPSANGVLIVE